MKLNSEELLYILDTLKIDLTNPENVKKIKEEWLTNTTITKNTSVESILIKLKKILEKLNFDLKSKENKDLLMNTLLNIETYKTESEQPSIELVSKTREQLITKTMEELKLNPNLKGYYLFKEAILTMFKLEETNSAYCSSMEKLYSYLEKVLNPTYFTQKQVPNAKTIKNQIGYLIKNSEKKLIFSENDHTIPQSAYYIYKNNHFTHLSNTYYLLNFKNYIQILEKTKIHKKR